MISGAAAAPALNCLDVARGANLGAGPIRGDEYSFHCPRHDDQRPSLRINEKKNCWICQPCRKAGNAWAFAAFIAGADPKDKSAVVVWLRKHGLDRHIVSIQRNHVSGNGIGYKIVATYPYVDEQSSPLYEVVRLEPKDFRQRRPDGRGGWFWNLDGTRRVLYRL